MHGHTIRHSEDHYCYHCIREISSNCCGFDVNYLTPAYKARFIDFLNYVDVRSPQECWPFESKSSRVKFPSYRSSTAKTQCENVTPAKIMFTAAWGDIGKLRIKRKTGICNDPTCVNPLHWECVANIKISPKTINPLVLKLDFAKIKQFMEVYKLGRLQDLRRTQQKQCIIHPKLVEQHRLE